jgi:hypothetical protein
VPYAYLLTLNEKEEIVISQLSKASQTNKKKKPKFAFLLRVAKKPKSNCVGGIDSFVHISLSVYLHK